MSLQGCKPDSTGGCRGDIITARQLLIRAMLPFGLKCKTMRLINVGHYYLSFSLYCVLSVVFKCSIVSDAIMRIIYTVIRSSIVDKCLCKAAVTINTQAGFYQKWYALYVTLYHSDVDPGNRLNTWAAECLQTWSRWMIHIWAIQLFALTCVNDG